MKNKIVIVDDHTLVAEAMKSMIEKFSNYEVIYDVRNGKELLDRFSLEKMIPDLVLLDINMPIMDGYETMDALHKNYPDVKVLALSMNDEEDVFLKMMGLGANGFIPKIAKVNILLEALDTIIKHGYYYTSEMTESLFREVEAKSNKHEIFLSEREKQLLKHICEDKTYVEIADEMCLSPKTVDGYRNSLFQKLNVKSRVGLAMYAVKNGYYS